MRHARVGFMGKSENVMQNSNSMVNTKDGTYSPKKRVKKRISGEFWWGMIFILPAVYLALNFKIFPLVRGLYDSLFHFYGGWDAKFVGIENFRRMFEDPVVRPSTLQVRQPVDTNMVFTLVHDPRVPVESEHTLPLVTPWRILLISKSMNHE